MKSVLYVALLSLSVFSAYAVPFKSLLNSGEKEISHFLISDLKIASKEAADFTEDIKLVVKSLNAKELSKDPKIAAMLEKDAAKVTSEDVRYLRKTGLAMALDKGSLKGMRVCDDCVVGRLVQNIDPKRSAMYDVLKGHDAKSLNDQIAKELKSYKVKELGEFINSLKTDLERKDALVALRLFKNGDAGDKKFGQALMAFAMDGNKSYLGQNDMWKLVLDSSKEGQEIMGDMSEILTVLSKERPLDGVRGREANLEAYIAKKVKEDPSLAPFFEKIKSKCYKSWFK